jgi:DegV family protein with EDD domain
MKSIRIVTDSTCDLPEALLQELGISVIPCFINIGEQSFLDNVEITRPQFYARLAKKDVFPKTSAPSVGLFIDLYEKLARQGAREILSIHIQSGLSTMSSVACLAANSVKSVKVRVVEVGQVALSLGFLVYKAAQEILEGKGIEEVISKIHDADQRTYILAAIEKLEYLKHSGRVPHLLLDLASVLNIKPVLMLHLGELSLAGRPRTIPTQMDAMLKAAMKFNPMEELGVVHANAQDAAQELLERARKALNFNGKSWIEEATPVLGVHVGPEAFGLAFVSAKK